MKQLKLNPAARKLPNQVYADVDPSGLTYGLDAVTPVTWRFVSKIPKSTKQRNTDYNYSLPSDLLQSPAYAEFIKTTGGVFYGSKRALQATLKSLL
jgi:hypothetical protein